jgi:hypothetical protein
MPHRSPFRAQLTNGSDERPKSPWLEAVPPAADAEVWPRVRDARAAVVADCRDQAVRAAVRPAVLLPHPGDVVGIVGPDGQPGLDLSLGVVEVRARDAALGRAAAPRREELAMLIDRAG